MGSPETLATLCTRYRTETNTTMKKNTTQKAKKISNTGLAIKPAENPGARVLIYRNFIVVIYVFVSFYHKGFTSPFLL
jgi:hypothetical protein